MFQSKIELNNTGKIDAILKGIVLKTYEESLEEKLLLCMECGDVDFYIAYSNNEELQDAINENFEIDECGEIVNIDEHQELMDDLYDYFLIIHKESDLFDFFPAGPYTHGGEIRESDTDMLAPRGLYSAPFEDAIKE
ncbi:hypothetical protein FC682_22065 [Peribacillus simplex]|uniref:Uncharacterized protein n=1 Tax=Peribacillus simplex TaxID=1478 RepID=A0A9X8ZI61_9BACI|nr:hypothetical protein [Peribacillus simplex]TKH02546.1 hypothetical protein FC682_22065 [Peribacillus simplex]TKH12618.1 hypothetical protein FC678_09135 [Peribacillus simplex]